MEDHPILTTSGTVYGAIPDQPGSGDISVTWGYSDETTFTTTYTGLAWTGRDDLTGQVRAFVAGPDDQQADTLITYS